MAGRSEACPLRNAEIARSERPACCARSARFMRLRTGITRYLQAGHDPNRLSEQGSGVDGPLSWLRYSRWGAQWWR
jgi:hypothetical protein